MKKTRSLRAKLSPLIAIVLGGVVVPAPAQTNLSLASDVRIADVGVVHAIAVQADGRIIIGGDFRWVNDVTRNHLARLWPDGSLDLTWNPDVNDRVDVLLIEGTNLYVGGHFTTIGTNSHSRIARINLTGNGAADTNWNVGADGPVRALLADGSHLFVGGSFSNFSGLPRTNLARVAVTNTGTVDPAWTPSTSESVRALAADATHVFVGGQFTNVSGTNRTYVAKLDRVTGLVDTEWNPAVNASSFNAVSPEYSAVCAIAVNGTNLYLAGNFTNVSAANRRCLAKLTTVGAGSVDTNWVGLPNTGGTGDVQAIGLSGTNLYIAGTWSQGVISGFGRLPLEATGGVETTGGNSFVSSEPKSLSIYGTNVYVGGVISTARPPSSIRHGITSFILGTGNLNTNFAPVVLRPGSINAIAKLPDGSTLIGGRFRFADNLQRQRIFKLTSIGTVDPNWNVTADNTVNSIVTDGTYIYVGGDFRAVNGSPKTNVFRTSLASLNGAPDPNWNVRGWLSSPTPAVKAMARDGRWLYVSGAFAGLASDLSTNISTRNLARVTATNGPANVDSSWGVTSSEPQFSTLAVANNQIFFSRISGPTTARFFSSIASNNLTGLPSGFDPQPNGQVYAIVSDGTHLYLGGAFSAWEGGTNYQQPYLARLVIATRTFDPTWTPAVNRDVTGLLLIGTNLVISGLFTEVNGLPRFGLAQISVNTGALLPEPRGETSGGGYSPFSTGLLSAGNGGVSGNVGERRPSALAIAGANSQLMIGGNFHRALGRRRDGFAILDSTPSPVATFTNWQTNFFSGPALADTNISGPLADAEGDSAQNLMEFALLLDPTLNDATPIVSPLGTNGLPTLRVENFGAESRLVVEYVRRRPEHQPDIAYTVEFAPHPSGPWQPGGVENIAFVPAPLERVIVVDSAAANPTNATRYARLRVTQR